VFDPFVSPVLSTTSVFTFDSASQRPQPSTRTAEALNIRSVERSDRSPPHVFLFGIDYAHDCTTGRVLATDPALLHGLAFTISVCCDGLLLNPEFKLRIGVL
jgi:hypothetical protein